MSKEKGRKWQQVIILDEDKNKQLSVNKLKCIYCDKIFSRGVACIKGHLLGEQSISKCLKGSDTVIDILKKEDNEWKELETKKQNVFELYKNLLYGFRYICNQKHIFKTNYSLCALCMSYVILDTYIYK